jgi:hypothetical protein
MDAGRVEIDKPCGEGRVEAESGDKEPRVELSAKTKSLGSDGGSEGGDVAVVWRPRGGEVRGITWMWRRCRDWFAGSGAEKGARLEGRAEETEVAAGGKRPWPWEGGEHHLVEQTMGNTGSDPIKFWLNIAWVLQIWLLFFSKYENTMAIIHVNKVA